MIGLLRYTIPGILALTSLSACQPEDAAQPVTLEGAWRLTETGGGITGEIRPTPANSNYRLVFDSDSTYHRYDQDQLVELNTYRLRPDPSEPAQQLLELKTTNTPTGAPIFKTYDGFSLTATSLEFKTPGGCPIISVYERVQPFSKDL